MNGQEAYTPSTSWETEDDDDMDFEVRLTTWAGGKREAWGRLCYADEMI